MLTKVSSGSVNPQPERIVRVASKLFAQRGYEATKLKDVAARCHFTHAAIYTYYKSKITILEVIFEEMMTRFSARLVEEEVLGLTPTQRLDAIIRSHVEMLLVDRDKSVVFFNEQSSLPLAWQRRVHAVLVEYTHRVRRVHEDGVASGEFHDIDSRVAANAILGMLNSTILWYRTDRGLLTLDRVADQLAALLTGGFAVEPQ